MVELLTLGKKQTEIHVGVPQMDVKVINTECPEVQCLGINLEYDV